MAWGAIAGSVISVVGGALLSDDHGAGDANKASADAAGTQAAIAKDQWQYYLENFRPLEQKYVGDAQNYNNDANRTRYTGEALTAVNTQFDNARQRLQRTPGLDTSSAAYSAAAVGLNRQQAAAGAVAQNQSSYRLDDMAHARQTDALSLGRGLPAQASTGLAAAAGLQNSRAQAGYAAGNAAGAGLGQLVSRGIDAYNRRGSGGPSGGGSGGGVGLSDYPTGDFGFDPSNIA